MARNVKRLVFLLFITLAFGSAVFSQNAEDRSIFGKAPDKDNEPKGIKEMLYKMQVDKEKKEYQAMLDRGKEALDLTEQVEKSFEYRRTLSSEDRQKIDTVEKLVKKVRSELGGNADDGDDDSDNAKPPAPADLVDGIKLLRSSAVKLVDELQKTTRFSISAAAIESSNSVLKTIRFLRVFNWR